VYVDNYLEGYLLPAAHPSLFRELDYAQYRVETHPYYSSQIVPIWARDAAGNPARRYDFTDRSRSALYYWIFPNFMLNVFRQSEQQHYCAGGAVADADIFEWFSYGRGVAQATIDFSDEIQQEDIRLCESVQQGLRSQHYHQGRFSVKRETKSTIFTGC
jgi:choline monooxygenase